MTEQTKANLEEIIKAKLDADEKIIDSLQDEVQEAFPNDSRQAELISSIAVKLYHNSSEIDELNVQGMQLSAILDSLLKILVVDKGLITEEELRIAVEETHAQSNAAIEKANQIYAANLGYDQDDSSQILTI